MTTISIHQLHEDTGLWVRKASELESIVVTNDGKAVAKIVPFTPSAADTPFLKRSLLPGFAELQSQLAGGLETTDIISEMRDRQ